MKFFGRSVEVKTRVFVRVEGELMKWDVDTDDVRTARRTVIEHIGVEAKRGAVLALVTP